MTQVKKQLTAGLHFLVNNQGKPFLKQYKMSPQADALYKMRFFAPRYYEHIYFIAFISPYSVLLVHTYFPFPSKQVTCHA